MIRLAVTLTILCLHTPLVLPLRYSAASPAQLRFAIENKYDQTGPGAKSTETAFHTYSTLEEALAAFLNDPDTKLPESERAKAIAYLYSNHHHENIIQKPSENYLGRSKGIPRVLSSYRNEKYEDTPTLNIFDFGDMVKFNPVHAQRLPAALGHRPSPLLDGPHQIPPPGRFDGLYGSSSYQYKPHPDVEFLDIHNRETGDLKSAQELRDGSGAVHGYFTVDAPDGLRRVVHYESSPHKHVKHTRSQVIRRQRVYRNLPRVIDHQDQYRADK